MLRLKHSDFCHKDSEVYHYRFYLFYVVFLLIFLNSFSFSQIYSNLEARRILHGLGVSSVNIIENVKVIKVTPGVIEGFDGGSHRRIFEVINEDDIILLDGATLYKTGGGEIIIKADRIFISAVLMKLDNRWHLIVGRTLDDIINFLADY